MSAALLLVALVVGLLIGAAGVGGLLLIPAIDLFAHIPIHGAMATALFTFVFTGLLGTFLFSRRGSIDWRITVPLCLGAAGFGFFGAWANARIDGRVLSLVLSLLIVVAGLNTVRTVRANRAPAFDAHPRRQRMLLLAIGAVSGFGSGLTGVGGPALSVPFMLVFGFSPLAAIGASQMLQILAAVSGTIGNLRYGEIDFRLAAVLTIFEIVGVYGGVKLVHAVNARSLKTSVGILCVLAGVGLAARALELV